MLRNTALLLIYCSHVQITNKWLKYQQYQSARQTLSKCKYETLPTFEMNKITFSELCLVTSNCY